MNLFLVFLALIGIVSAQYRLVAVKKQLRRLHHHHLRPHRHHPHRKVVKGHKGGAWFGGKKTHIDFEKLKPLDFDKHKIHNVEFDPHVIKNGDFDKHKIHDFDKHGLKLEDSKFEYLPVDQEFHETHFKKYYDELNKMQQTKYEDLINYYQGSHKKLESYVEHPFENVYHHNLEDFKDEEKFEEIKYEDSHEYHEPANYAFKYSVNDPLTGDVKSHEESRKGDEVRGFYTLKQPDGSTREVRYTAGKHTGFRAVVTNKGLSKHPVHEEPTEYDYYKKKRH